MNSGCDTHTHTHTQKLKYSDLNDYKKVFGQLEALLKKKKIVYFDKHTFKQNSSQNWNSFKLFTKHNVQNYDTKYLDFFFSSQT